MYYYIIITMKPAEFCVTYLLHKFGLREYEPDITSNKGTLSLNYNESISHL